MNERERKLLIVLVAAVGLGVVVKYMYPGLVKPMFEYPQRIAAASEELESLAFDRDQLETRLGEKYKSYVLRSGGVNAGDVFQDLQDQVYEMLRQAKLTGLRLTPRPPSEDRKTRITTLAMSVTGTGDYDQCIAFLESFYRLPYVVRLESVKFTPTAARQRAGHNEVKFDADIEALVPPASEAFGVPQGPQPKVVARTTNRGFSQLERWTPFTQEVAVAEATPPPTPRPRTTPRPTPTPPRGPDTWSDANAYVARVAQRYGDHSRQVDEIVLERTTDFANVNVAVGEELDGGELVLVNAWGAVVHKYDEDRDFGYFVYPLGEALTSRIPLAQATDWPEIQVAMNRYIRENADVEEVVGPPQDAPEPEEADGQRVEAERDVATDALLRNLARALGPSDLPADDAPLVGPPAPTSPDDAAKATDGPADADTTGVAEVDTTGMAEVDTNGTAPASDDAENGLAGESSKPVGPRPAGQAQVQPDAGNRKRGSVQTRKPGRSGSTPSRRVNQPNTQPDRSPAAQSRGRNAAADANKKENDHVAPPE